MTAARSARPPAGQRLLGTARLRRPPTPGRLARRRWLIILAKLVLPVFALALLTVMAVWPELSRTAREARLRLQQLSGHVSGATLTDARYHGLDDRGRPFTVTAATATQAGPNRFNLTQPKGDITLENGTWLMLQSDHGVYRQDQRALDLSAHVALYRDDGTTLRTASAAIDLRNGAAAGAEPVHAEGPFGVLDAAGGFTVTDRGGQVLFAGPAQLVLNGATAQ